MIQTWLFETSGTDVHKHFYGNDKFGPTLTWMITCTKGIGILFGIIGFVYALRDSLQERGKQGKRSIILPMYIPLLFLVILSFIIELTSLWLWEISGYHFIYYILQLILQSFVSDGFVQYLTLGTFSGKAQLRAVLYVFISACYGALFGVFMGIELYPIALVYATYHVIAACYHVYLFYPWAPNSCVTQKRPGIKQFSMWIFGYRMAWALLSTLRYLYDEHWSKSFDTPLTYVLYLFIGLIAILDFPFTLIYFVILRSETKYWYHGEKLLGQPHGHDNQDLAALGQRDNHRYQAPVAPLAKNSPFSMLVNHDQSLPLREFTQASLIDYLIKYLDQVAILKSPPPKTAKRGDIPPPPPPVEPLHDDSLILSFYPVINYPVDKKPIYQLIADAPETTDSLSAEVARHKRQIALKRQRDGFVHIEIEPDSTHDEFSPTSDEDETDGILFRDSFDPNQPHEVVRVPKVEIDKMNDESDMLNLASTRHKSSCCTTRTWNIFTLGLYGFVCEVLEDPPDEENDAIPLFHVNDQENHFHPFSDTTSTPTPIRMEPLKKPMPTPVSPANMTLVHPSHLRHRSLRFMDDREIGEDVIIGLDRVLGQVSHLCLDNNQLLTETAYLGRGGNAFVFRGELIMKPNQHTTWNQHLITTTPTLFCGFFDALIRAYQEARHHQLKGSVALSQSATLSSAPLPLKPNEWARVLGVDPSSQPCGLLPNVGSILNTSLYPPTRNRASFIKSFRAPDVIALKYYHYNKTFQLWSKQAYITHLMLQSSVVLDVFNYTQFAQTVSLIESQHQDFRIDGVLFLYSLLTLLYTQHILHTLNSQYFVPLQNSAKASGTPLLRTASSIPKRILEILTQTDCHPFITNNFNPSIVKRFSTDVNKLIMTMNKKRAASLLSRSSWLFSFDYFPSFGFANPMEFFRQSPESIHQYINYFSDSSGPILPRPSSPTTQGYGATSPALQLSPESTPYGLVGSPKNRDFGREQTGEGAITPSTYILSALSGYSVTVDAGPSTSIDPSSNRIPVAIKFFTPQMEKGLEEHEKLVQEIVLQASMRHRNVVYCHGFYAGRPALAGVFDIIPRGALDGLVSKQQSYHRRIQQTADECARLRRDVSACSDELRVVNIKYLEQQQAYTQLLERNKRIREEQTRFQTMTQRQLSEQRQGEQDMKDQLDQLSQRLNTEQKQLRVLLTQHHLSQRKFAVQSAELWDLRYRLSLARDAAASIAFLHEQKLLHRDIKSENYLVADDDTLLLSDFGITIRLSETVAEIDHASKAFLLEHSEAALTLEEIRKHSANLSQRRLMYPLPSITSSDSEPSQDSYWVDFSRVSALLAQCSEYQTSPHYVVSNVLSQLKPMSTFFQKDTSTSTSTTLSDDGSHAFAKVRLTDTTYTTKITSSVAEKSAEPLASSSDDPSASLHLDDPMSNYLHTLFPEPAVTNDEQEVDSEKQPYSAADGSFEPVFPIYRINTNHRLSFENLCQVWDGEGTPDWMPPEVETSTYTTYPADVYALGVTLAEIICRLTKDDILPFRDRYSNPLEQSCLFSSEVPFYLRIAILACLDDRPECRPTAAQIRDLLELFILLIDLLSIHQSRNLLRF